MNFSGQPLEVCCRRRAERCGRRGGGGGGRPCFPRGPLSAVEVTTKRPLVQTVGPEKQWMETTATATATTTTTTTGGTTVRPRHTCWADSIPLWISPLRSPGVDRLAEVKSINETSATTLRPPVSSVPARKETAVEATEEEAAEERETQWWSSATTSGSTNRKKERRCSHCRAEHTPQWRLGPEGPGSLCNACGIRYRSGRLVPEYRPAASPTFDSFRHSNSHRVITKMKR